MAFAEGLGSFRAGGVALLDEVLTFAVHHRALALRGEEVDAVATGCPTGSGEHEDQAEKRQGADGDAVEEQRAGRAGDVIAEDREVVGEFVGAAEIGHDPGHRNNQRGEQDDQAHYEDHGALPAPHCLVRMSGRRRKPANPRARLPEEDAATRNRNFLHT
ncbi:hypothetical protein AB0D46_15615 [Streptomyces sp. NPDC048383]|uniref:hypothetical protein n=1 Tax=Streptomyces sp. NPDC048383 TaxID=3155386 RepID=UPI0034321FA1